MTPEEVVLQLKKKGTFDELRKQALQEFQANESGQTFINDIQEIMQKLEAEDPALFTKDKSHVHNIVLDRLENHAVYNDARQKMLDHYLHSEAVSTRIDKEIRAIVPDETVTRRDVSPPRQRERSSSKESGEADD
ncbi:hypothetical protein INT44_001874 [Umbelopsis vinacea]|uniref:BOD1/SHG1 domain-containing protein n=1 Tax=Umbelopsis vinacea TaxID=44442 RepID=A0A8H7PRE3_9FUNG|nr:hypothetical protein INT44_001874 [Umbelopsis vinacea]KAI9284118.1 hypothetical protein BC943DRAFT_326371 [Umbelopsis sp. AD052]